MTDRNRSVASRLLEKALMPIVATAASAAAGFAAKKAPQLYESKVAPKVRDLIRTDPGDVAEHLTERVKSVTKSSRSPATQTRRTGKVSREELQRRTKERAKHRAARRNTSK